MTENNDKKKGKDDNTVYIGKKPSMSYVLAVVTQFSDGADEVEVKARGRAISKAVDVCEIVKNKFVEESKIADIQTGTEELEGKDKEKVNVSTIALTMRK